MCRFGCVLLQMPAVGLSWNCTGSVIAVAYPFTGIHLRQHTNPPIHLSPPYPSTHPHYTPLILLHTIDLFLTSTLYLFFLAAICHQSKYLDINCYFTFLFIPNYSRDLFIPHKPRNLCIIVPPYIIDLLQTSLYLITPDTILRNLFSTQSLRQP